jgi:acetyltransferase-like isoleucine patch superfamily enzyme
MSRPQSVRSLPASTRWTAGAIWRASVTVVAILAMETLVVGLAAILPALALTWLAGLAGGMARAAILAAAAGPAYVLFALCLMALSPASTWLTGARTPADAELRIADMSWPLMQWARYLAAAHVVRVFAGALFRGTPLWTMYLRLNGARLGRRVFVNSLSVSDHNLLQFGHDVVIGAEVQLSGHTVERGVVKTGSVVLGDGVTIGLCSVVDIDVEIGARTQVGALSFVPKHARLDAGGVYAGIPVRPLTTASGQPPAILGTKSISEVGSSGS